MQQTNKNKQKRNLRIANLRSDIKKIPIIHSTIDRVQKLIEKQTKAQTLVEDDQTKSIEMNKSDFKIKSENNLQAKFILGKKIGQGAHGYVKECYHKQTGKMYALKTIPSDHQFYYYLKRNFVNIVDLDHPNVIKYKAFYFDMMQQTCLLVMQFMPFPNLSEIVIQNEEELKRIVYEIIQGVQYIHKQKICHRDIKPENVLFDRQNNKSILIDFGVSCKFHQRGSYKQMLTLTGTPFYRAPQMFTGGGYDQRVDMWALGILIYKLITKTTPFQSEYHSDTINNILKGQISFYQTVWNQYSHLAKDLVAHLLKPKQSRLTIKQAKNHFWFESFRFQSFGEEEMTKSAGFDSFFSLKNPTLSPVITVFGSPKMFSLQKYQKQEQNMRWIALQESIEMDLIQSEDQESSTSPSPRIKPKRNVQ